MFFVPIIFFSKKLCKLLTYDFFNNRLPRKFDGQARVTKIDKCVTNLFKCFYFSVMQVYGFVFVLSDQPYHAPSIGGEKSWNFIYKGYPYFEITPYMKYFYLVDLSYHVESWLHHVLSPPKNDFVEMFLHHLIIVVLLAGSYLTNLMNGGIPVMMVMDHADIWIGLIRMNLDISGRKTMALMLAGLLAQWVYIRIFVFPFELLWYTAFDQWAL